VRPLSHRIAALAVICAFAALPLLARIHDRVTAHDDVTRFRLSQNLERPHEKEAVAGLVATPVFRVAPDTTTLQQLVAPASGSPLHDAFVCPTAPRAPPVR
jgi:hypothetical protein